MKRTLTTHWRNSKAHQGDAVHFPPQTDQRRLCCTVVNPNNHFLTSPLVYLHLPSAYHRQKASFSATLSFYLDASRPPTTHLLAHSSLSQVSMPFAPGLKDKDPSEITNSSIAFIFAELLSPDTTAFFFKNIYLFSICYRVSFLLKWAVDQLAFQCTGSILRVRHSPALLLQQWRLISHHSHIVGNCFSLSF